MGRGASKVGSGSVKTVPYKDTEHAYLTQRFESKLANMQDGDFVILQQLRSSPYDSNPGTLSAEKIGNDVYIKAQMRQGEKEPYLLQHGEWYKTEIGGYKEFIPQGDKRFKRTNWKNGKSV